MLCKHDVLLVDERKKVDKRLEKSSRIMIKNCCMRTSVLVRFRGTNILRFSKLYSDYKNTIMFFTIHLHINTIYYIYFMYIYTNFSLMSKKKHWHFFIISNDIVEIYRAFYPLTLSFWEIYHLQVVFTFLWKTIWNATIEN